MPNPQQNVSILNTLHEKHPHLHTCDLQTYLQRLSKEEKVEKSAYTYLKVINKNADREETILEALCTLHKELDVSNTMQYLVVAGDYKTYNHIQTVKQTYQTTPMDNTISR